MYRLTHCPCCDSEISHTIAAVVAPFVRERIRCAQVDAELCKCPHCGFLCYRDRYEPAEIAALYQGYRGEDYLQQRRRHEPWYTRRLNDSIGGPEEVARRNRRL